MKRAVFRVILFLLLGAIVNVAVAWGLAWRTTKWVLADDADAGAPTAFDDQDRVIESWWVERWEAFGGTSLRSGRYQFPPTPRGEYEGLNEPVDVLPGWADFDPPSPEYVSGKVEGDMRVAELRGWPLRALGCTMYFDFPAGQFLPAMAIDVSASAGAGSPRLLPLRPIWPGFAINTLFYAFILWLLLIAPFALRRRRRIKRGLCPKCGYNLRGIPSTSDACPECGAPPHPRIPAPLAATRSSPRRKTRDPHP